MQDTVTVDIIGILDERFNGHEKGESGIMKQERIMAKLRMKFIVLALRSVLY
jgi:hypothetical protein